MNQRPLPDVDCPVASPFWRAAREHRFIMQQCPACGHVRWPPRPLCPVCLRTGEPTDWVKIPDQGTIWSFCVYHHAFHPGLADSIPYNVAYVKLDAGPMFITNVIGTNDLSIGSRVKVCFEQIDKKVTLVKFRLEIMPTHPRD